MKFKKIFFRTLFLNNVAMLPFSLCLMSLKCTSQNKNNDFKKLNQIKNKIGLWQWKIENINDEKIKFMKENNIKEIYLAFEKLTNDNKKILQKLKDNNINVYWLLGNKKWILNSEELIKKIKYFENNFDLVNLINGIHLDIEPHQIKELWNKDEKSKLELLVKFLDLIKTLKNKFPKINFDYDIPFWFKQIINYDGINQEMYKHIIKYANRVFIMAYRIKHEKIIKISKEIIDYAQINNKKVFIAVETSKSNEKNVSFYDKNIDYFVNEIFNLANNININVGIAIHNLDSMLNLKK